MDALERYLRRHAEPTAQWAPQIRGEFSRAVVLPVLGEHPSCLDHVIDQSADPDTLLVVVVNETADAPPSFRDANARILERLGRQRQCTIAGRPCVVIDATATGQPLPAGQGVGLARKLGFDLALALWDAGRLASEWMHSADADARWPASALTFEHPTAVGVVCPFWHETSDASADATHRATSLYELWMREYAAGLRRAGSPWGFVPLGSALAVRASAYASVGGMPRRTGGEDFYLLAKLGKVGELVQADCAPISIQARESSRAPFGTGPAVRSMLQRSASGDDLALYAPSVFGVLAEVLGAARAAGAVGHPAFLEVGGPSALAKAQRVCTNADQRRRKFDEWMDPLRTLRLVHAIESKGHPRIPWRDAFEQAEGSAVWACVEARRRELAAPPGTLYGALAGATRV